MAQAFISLLCIAVVALLAPLTSWIIPRRLVPETVLLILGGMLIGPAALGIAHEVEALEFLKELGLAFLFLMAGYEIDVNELRGSGGRHATMAWLGSLALAFGTVAIIGVPGGVFSANGIAIAIAMTSTAIGMILPILRERGLLSTAVGTAILNHGAVGEVGPVILMALLLGSRSAWQSLAILAVFFVITLRIVALTDRVKRVGRRLVEAIRLGGKTTAQTTIRVTVVLLVGLCTVAEVFHLDVVLGAFAAGFILRYAVPDGNQELEEKLDGLAYGFFVPIFFVVSGMGIELEISARSVTALGVFLVLLVLTRGVPVWVAAWRERRRDGSRAYSVRQSLQIAVYSTTALPIIVAVTEVAVDAEAMSRSFASTLVLAGVVSVLVMPALGLALSSEVDHTPANEALGVVQGPLDKNGKGAEEASAGTYLLDAGPGDVVVSEPRRPAGPVRRTGDVAPEPPGPQEDESESVSRREAGVLARLTRDREFHHRGLSEEESRYLADRLAQMERERAEWREKMRRQRSLEREESQQRRAVLRAQERQRRREERRQVQELRQEILDLRRADRPGDGTGPEPDSASREDSTS